MQMNVALRVGDADPFCIEAGFDCCVQIKIDPPVIRGINPGPNGKVDAVVCQFEHADRWFGIFENTIFLGEDIYQDRFDVTQISVVADANHQVDSSGRFG